MTTCPEPLLAAIDSQEPISAYWISYFRENFKASLHDELLDLLISYEAAGHTRAELARKLSKRPEQVSRWFRNPGNLEMDTVSDLALAMGFFPKVTFSGLKSQAASNYIVAPFSNFSEFTDAELSDVVGGNAYISGVGDTILMAGGR